MQSYTPAHLLFQLVEHRLELSASNIRKRIFSEYRDLHWTAEQRKALEPLVRKELDELVHGILAIFDNVGSVIPDTPDRTIGFRIHNLYIDPGVEDATALDEIANKIHEGPDIALGNMDYADMWLDFIQEE